MIVGQFIGGAQIFAGLTGINYELGLVIFALVTVLYSSGGFRAVAITDAICAFLMLTGMFVLGYVIISEGGGLEKVMDTIGQVNINEATGISRNLEYDAGGALPIGLLFSTWILVGFATVGLPQSLVRCMSYKSSHELHKSMIIATLVCGALMIGMTMLGVLARAVVTQMPAGGTDTVIPTLIATHMHPLIAGVTILGPLAATMSTVSSLLIAAASAVVRDLFKSLHKDKHESEHELIEDSVKNNLSYHEKLIVKGTAMSMGVIAIILALFPMDVVAWINLFAFGGLESAFVWPIILGMFSRRFNTCGLLTSIGCSISVYAIGMIFKISLFSAHSIVPALIAGLIGAIIGSYIGNHVLKQQMSLHTHKIFFPHKSYLG